ncbi:MAG: IclR family transcriptional regulator [Chloroflexota bacterium]
MTGVGDRYVVRSVARALDILDVLQDAPEGASLTTLSQTVELPKSSVFRYLNTLEMHGYVQQDASTGAYRLGMGFVPSHARHLEVLSARARPFLERLRDRFKETVNLAVLDGNRIAYVAILESRRAMRLAARVGDRVPIHSSALGKAICATMADEDVLEMLRAEGMPMLTAKTITEEQAFLTEIEAVRRSGRAIDDGEHEEDGRCVAVAVVGSRIPAAISLSAPAVRFTMDEVAAVADALMDAARELAGTRRDER